MYLEVQSFLRLQRNHTIKYANLFFQVAQKDGYNDEYINTSYNVFSVNIFNIGVY
jgi:hypothetical protein